jgi:N-carbamoyl-L-amino-acid hydrolase
VIAAGDIEARLAGLDLVGLRADGLHRLAWTQEDHAAGEWFRTQAAALGLTVDRDAAGNLWACPPSPPPWVGLGSHLDTVAGGGRYDGALGVACAFAVAAATDRPVAVVSFADEEGARFNTPTFGSRALAGRPHPAETLTRVDADGITLATALRDAGVDPGDLASAPEAIRRLSAFVEVHIDQSRELEEAGAAVGVVSGLASRMRVAVEITGEADHAGTTRRSERRDALAAAARLIVVAEDLAVADPRFVVTPTRILAEPNALSTIAGAVRLWIDARAPTIDAVDGWRSSLHDAARAVAAERRVDVRVETASRSPGIVFDPEVRRALGRSGDVPELVCFAGHDAGVLAERLPAGMVLVRNPTGVSHSPAEAIDVADAAIAASTVLSAVKELA